MKKPQQKGRILQLNRMLLQETDHQHGLTLQELTDRLEKLGVSVERKTLYDDLQTLVLFGLDVQSKRVGNRTYYQVVKRPFEVAEIKLLIDAVESSKFITKDKTAQLIQKMETLTSHYEASQLNRHVFVANRVKAMNESNYDTVDLLHDAINFDRRIQFHLTERVVDFSTSQKFRRQFRRNGKWYRVSPWELTWNDGNYYLVGFEEESGCIRHFRVDRMADLTMVEQKREGLAAYRGFDVGAYAKKVFNMFGGEEERVQMRFANDLLDAILERFGEDVYLRPDGEDHFLVATDVLVSPQFYGWLFGFGKAAKLCSPPTAVEGFVTWMKESFENYQEK